MKIHCLACAVAMENNNNKSILSNCSIYPHHVDYWFLPEVSTDLSYRSPTKQATSKSTSSLFASVDFASTTKNSVSLLLAIKSSGVRCGDHY
jgi:hypothetical protein